MPELEWGPPAGSYNGLDELAVAPGPETSEHRTGTCGVCRSHLRIDHDDAIIAAEPTTP
jgi:hypothetical protein